VTAVARPTGTVGYANRMSRVQPSAIRELLRLGTDPDIISFGGGYPDPALFPIEELHQVYADLLTPPTRRRCSTRRRTGCRSCGLRSPSASPATACRRPRTTC
jgi:DNA-binding transcriptional MocR family regulator